MNGKLALSENGTVGKPKKEKSFIADSLSLVKMEHYTGRQEKFVVDRYFKNNGS